MGWKYEVHDYYEDVTDGRGRCYHLAYQTEYLALALWTMWGLKRDGAACVKLEWRT